MEAAARAGRLVAAVLGISVTLLANTHRVALEDSVLRTYAQLAENGAIHAEETWGFLLRGGLLIGDPNAAVFWLTRAARRGDTDAQVALADMYREGSGIEANARAAIEWYREAVPASPYAAWRLAQLLDTGDARGPNSEEPLRLYLHAAEAGFSPAENSVGNLFMAGIYVQQDYAKALEWYWKAARSGYADAFLNLAGMYYLGLGVERNHQRAVELARTAALNHARDAAAFLAEMERDGRDGPSR